MNVKEDISWQDFEKIDFRSGTIISAELLENARKPAYVLSIDFGETLGIKKSSAQITELYKPQELIGKQILAIVNFPKKQIGSIMSECLVCGFYTENGVVLTEASHKIKNGSKLG